MNRPKKNIKNLALTPIQKQVFLHWKIPYLSKMIKSQYGLSCIHIISSSVFSAYKKGWVLFYNNTGFPIEYEGEFLGMIVCFKKLGSKKSQEIRDFIDSFFVYTKEKLKNQKAY